MNPYVDRSVTLLFKLKHFWMSSDTCAIVVALFLSMLFCHSPDIALNSLATSVGISFCIICRPVYISLGSKLFTCLFISWSMFRFVMMVVRSIDRTW